MNVTAGNLCKDAQCLLCGQLGLTFFVSVGLNWSSLQSMQSLQQSAFSLEAIIAQS